MGRSLSKDIEHTHAHLFLRICNRQMVKDLWFPYLTESCRCDHITCVISSYESSTLIFIQDRITFLEITDQNVKVSSVLRTRIYLRIYPRKPVFDETTYTSTYRVRIHDEKVKASMVRNQKRISKSDRYASRSFEKVTTELWIYIYSYVELELVKVLKCRVITLSTVNEFSFFLQNSTYNLYAWSRKYKRNEFFPKLFRIYRFLSPPFV